ncbi:SDR family NAD(P)-dependent oxidoreductase [Sinomonas sp. G460-2]|uniref:SDR family NAD(P)-dependent oxidoreductase n=1 Tax=Sinomonas sp. G460-2 TaxID=3393464 RepID=UPI0039EF0A2C
MSTAIVTGASKGLGKALSEGLAQRGWSLIVDGRDSALLERARGRLWKLVPPGSHVLAIPGDVTDPDHRRALAGAAHALGGLDLLVCNAGVLGPSPLPSLAEFSLTSLRELFEVYPVATLGLIQECLPLLRAANDGGRVALISSDAAVEGYPGWGGYGAAKAAQDQLARVLGAEEPTLSVWAVDPGDMRTDMHQAAFPGEDITDRPLPEAVVPRMIELFESRQPSGRIRLADLPELPS